LIRDVVGKLAQAVFEDNILEGDCASKLKGKTETISNRLMEPM
jgi:hypothetical protein